MIKKYIKKPENFRDILGLQKILDENIHSNRERTLTDIQMSMIAEIVEFNEETRDSHKTWKTKEYDRDKELEELTDVYFFLAQLMNYKKSILEGYIQIENKVFEIFEDKFVLPLSQRNVNTLITRLMCGGTIGIMKILYGLTLHYGYTKEDILNCYWNKWQKNMTRIGKEWD